MRVTVLVAAAAVALCAVVCGVAAKPVIPTPYPLYKQCDNQWANDQMGTDASCSACGQQPATVCEQGCAMSCVTMAMAGWGVTVPAAAAAAAAVGGAPDAQVTATPGTMNAWLHATSGYWCAWGDCNNLVLTAPERLSTPRYNVTFVSENEKPALAVLQMWLVTEGWVSVLHVRNKTHFVLATGWDDADPHTLYVNDPGFDQTTYRYDDVADILLYTVLPPAPAPAPAATTRPAPVLPRPNDAPRPYARDGTSGPTTGWLSQAKLWGVPRTEEAGRA